MTNTTRPAAALDARTHHDVVPFTATDVYNGKCTTCHKRLAHVDTLCRVCATRNA